MVSRILFIILLFPVLLSAQESEQGIVRAGLLRTQGTISFGKLLTSKESTMYLQGNLEYYISEKISARSDIFYYLKSNELNSLDINHQLFSGTSYHINTNGNFNPYIGFQPGIAITKSSPPLVAIPEYSAIKTSTSLTPLISTVIGFNFFAYKWFHLFMDMRYVYGNHLSNVAPVSLSEFRFSFGLGFNINTK